MSEWLLKLVKERWPQEYDSMMRVWGMSFRRAPKLTLAFIAIPCIIIFLCGVWIGLWIGGTTVNNNINLSTSSPALLAREGGATQLQTQERGADIRVNNSPGFTLGRGWTNSPNRTLDINNSSNTSVGDITHDVSGAPLPPSWLGSVYKVLDDRI